MENNQYWKEKIPSNLSHFFLDQFINDDNDETFVCLFVLFYNSKNNFAH